MMKGGGMQQLMKQANQMQARIKKMKEKFSQEQFETTSGGGAVTIKVSGENLLTAITINPEVTNSEDVEILQDMILSATNEALKLAKESYDKEMSKITGGGTPGML